MKEVIILCEESQTVTKAFREKGIKAFSCDLLPCSGSHPEWHLQEDAKQVALENQEALKISFPPCTHIAVSGAKHFEGKRADGRQREAIIFFLEMWRLSDCTENPIGIMNNGKYLQKWFPKLYEYAVFIGFPFKPTQIVQPYMFGDPFTKGTCLWLKGLPKLVPTDIVDKGKRHITKGGNSLPEWYNLPPSEDRGKLRSKTFPGLAKAMAEQWSFVL